MIKRKIIIVLNAAIILASCNDKKTEVVQEKLNYQKQKKLQK